MERKVTIVDTATQYNNTFDSNATTLAELKNELRALGVNFDGKDFREGISRTVLIDDASQLPSNLMYKGQPTNDLVIVLTAGKIKSGMCLSRSSVYLIIKEEGLANPIKEKTGKNYTNLPTEVLITLIEELGGINTSPEEEEEAPAPTFDFSEISSGEKVLDTFFLQANLSIECYFMLRAICNKLEIPAPPMPAIFNSMLDKYNVSADDDIDTVKNNTKYSNDELCDLIDGVL